MTARVLIVDDAAAVARMLAARLAAEYFEVATALNGVEALAMAARWRPDVVLLDVMMPGTDGFEVCRRLCRQPDTGATPVILLTALDRPADRLRGLAAGADDFMSKPVDFDLLLARIRSLALAREREADLREAGRAVSGGADMLPPRRAQPSVAGARALVIADRPSHVATLRDALAQDGIVCGWAATEADALSLCASIAFDLIVLDLALQTGEPLRVAARLRAMDGGRRAPLLLLAPGDALRADLLRGAALGASDWLAKPLDVLELRARARANIRRGARLNRLRADLVPALAVALTDPQTGFYNALYLERHLRAVLEADCRDTLAVLLIDIDHLRAINDRFGHAVGDAAIGMVARVLRAHARVLDVVARQGGQAFVVVSPGVSRAEAGQAAEVLRTEVEATPFFAEPRTTHPVTVSVGVAFIEQGDAAGRGDVGSPDRLLGLARVAMRMAKQAGRNAAALTSVTGQPSLVGSGGIAAETLAALGVSEAT